MNIKKVFYMCASLTIGLSLSTQVSALGLPLPVGTIEMYFTGGDTQAVIVRELMSSVALKNDLVTQIGICERGAADGGPSDTLDIFEGLPRGNWNAYSCTIRAGVDIDPALVGQNVIVQKRDAGGSAVGAHPVAHGGGTSLLQPVPDFSCSTGLQLVAPDFCVGFMEISAINCPGAAALRFVAPGDTRRIHNCDEAVLVLRVSDGGWSTVEPRLFGRNSNIASAGGIPVTRVTDSQLVTVRQNQLIFNTPVTLALRNALQVAEFGAAHGCVTGALDADSIACMPSLTRRDVQSLMVGTITRWNQLDVINPAGDRVPLTTVVIPGGANGVNEVVRICRRVRGSGTQAQFNAIVLFDGCVADAIPAATASIPFIGPSIILNSGSSDVGRCLDDMHTGANTSGRNVFNFANQTPAAAGSWAIGVQSTQRNADEALDYRFIRIDGAPPTGQAVHAGEYFDWAEQTFQTRGGIVTARSSNAYEGTAANFNPDGNPTAAGLVVRAAVNGLFQQFVDNAGLPEILRGINAATATHNLNGAFGDAWVGGYLALPRNGIPDQIFNPFNPVNNAARAPLGLPPSNCRIRIQL